MKYTHCDLYGGPGCLDEIPLWLGLIIILGIIFIIVRIKISLSKNNNPEDRALDMKTIKEISTLLIVLIVIILIPLIMRWLWS
jgi:hypothetical protein